VWLLHREDGEPVSKVVYPLSNCLRRWFDADLIFEQNVWRKCARLQAGNVIAIETGYLYL
jgi:hypothetical protein